MTEESQSPTNSAPSSSSDKKQPGSNPSGDKKGRDQGGKPARRPVAPTNWIVGILLLLTLLIVAQQFAPERAELSYSAFYDEVQRGNVQRVEVEGTRLYGKFVTPPTVAELKARRKAKQRIPNGESTQDSSNTDNKEVGNQESSSSGSASSESGTEQSQSATPEDSEGNAEEADSSEDAKKTEPKVLPEEFVVEVQGGVDKDLRQMLIDNNVELGFRQQVDWNGIITLLWIGVLVVMGFMIFSFMRRARDQMMGGGMLGSVTKSPARRYDAEDGKQVTFEEVAGLKGVKRDLKEVVQFLKEPEKFQSLGARVPKGVLLSGPPGTGKTLLAKAVAGEAGVPFFSINGSEFIQLFVGVGASRVRDMFKTAKRAAPSILFIDEIDAIGRQRGAGMGGGHDEREQTLNQILSEMDGFSQSETVIVIAATNRPDVLDPALLRPGRFDRHVTVGRPSIEGRRQLFDVHSRNVPVAEDVDFDKLAQATVGLTGADIQNLVNEAALWATRHERKFVTMDDFEFARDKVLMGANSEHVLTEHEKKVTAYHEAGHALVAWLQPSGSRVHKVTIVPRGQALGVTQLVPEEDRHNMGQQEMHARLAMLLAGRAAEKLIFDEFTAGAESDLKEATKLSRRMVTAWGMSERIGPVAYNTSEDHPFLGREMAQEHRQFSEHTAQMIDDEVAKILHTAADRARRILSEGKPKLEAIANALLEKEEISDDDIAALIGPPVIDPSVSDKPAIEVAPPEPAPATSRSDSNS